MQQTNNLNLANKKKYVCMYILEEIMIVESIKIAFEIIYLHFV